MLSMLCLTACATTHEAVSHEPLPASLLTCRDQPEPPASGQDTDLPLWIVDLADAGADCRSKLNHLVQIVQPAHGSVNSK